MAYLVCGAGWLRLKSRNGKREKCVAWLWADEEPVDPKKYLEERCKPQCVKPLYEYEKCVKRVEKDDTGHKHCTGQYFDYWSCIDKCVAPKLLEKLK
uniref:Complex III subunit VI n=1 Tax=Oryza sativa subsp. japonica TaxID=39947 RepID=Q53PN7_ORYSJ|nr:ubiquinol--cytochrome-c reductase, putative [Oryza sativa Japonica Group]